MNRDRRAELALELIAEAATAGELKGHVRVRGGCMAPLIADGDEVELASAAGPLLPGQIVVVRCGAELLCHRLLALAPEQCLVAGDGDLRLDTLPREELLGRVAAVVSPRFGGARLAVPALPGVAQRLLTAWQRWSCRHRQGRLAGGLEGLRRRLLARLAAGAWRAARQPSRPSSAEP